MYMLMYGNNYNYHTDVYVLYRRNQY